jgi:flavodoxin
MRIAILHDSQAGNGEKLAQTMKSAFEEQGAEVTLGHVKELAPETVVAEAPDLLVLGAAIRAFHTSPPSKKWLKGFDAALKAKGTTVPAAAAFITHGLPVKAANGWGNRFRRRLERAGGISKVYPEWLSGRVVGQQGPLEDGAEERFREHARKLFEWMKS